ncbi:hypothetical protein JCGZ_15340 [Jatropha curcas]|uniref:Uncharacterized protein n=1 Tax=Jatropha curcas TaxID=180498 RepID=A0A067KGR8_JATCU|nr:hypothetical protein JCGZ_15340 [Jatropha curcas]
MSQHLTDEKVDSYVPPSGGIPVGDATSGVVGSDAEHALMVGQVTAGPAGLNQDTFVQQLVAALRQAVGAVPQAPVAPAPIPVRPPIEKLRKYGAVEFMGRKDDVASAAEYWLQSVERILEHMQCSPLDSLVRMVPLAPNVASAVGSLGIGRGGLHLVVSEHRFRQF